MLPTHLSAAAHFSPAAHCCRLRLRQPSTYAFISSCTRLSWSRSGGFTPSPSLERLSILPASHRVVARCAVLLPLCAMLGSQRAGAGIDLVRAFPYARAVYAEADEALQSLRNPPPEPLSHIIWNTSQVSAIRAVSCAAANERSSTATQPYAQCCLMRLLLSIAFLGSATGQLGCTAGHTDPLDGCVANTMSRARLPIRS